jgi:hypothetical protein
MTADADLQDQRGIKGFFPPNLLTYCSLSVLQLGFGGAR